MPHTWPRYKLHGGMAGNRQRQLQDQAAGVIRDAAHDVQSSRRPAHEDVQVLPKQWARHLCIPCSGKTARSRSPCSLPSKVGCNSFMLRAAYCELHTSAPSMLASRGFAAFLPLKFAAVGALHVAATNPYLAHHVLAALTTKYTPDAALKGEDGSPWDCEVSASWNPRSRSRNSAVSGSSDTRSAPADVQHTMFVGFVAVNTAPLHCVREHRAPWLTQHRTDMTTVYIEERGGCILVFVLVETQLSVRRIT